MKKTAFAFLGLALAVSLAYPAAAWSFEFVGGDQASLPAEQIEDDVYIFGGNVNSTAEVVGDLVAGGGNVLIDGSVSQDLFVGGGSITIIGDVGDDLRVGGGNVSITGSIGGDLIIGGGQVQITGETIAGDLAVAVGTLMLNTPVQGDASIAGGQVTINSAIAGNVSFKGERLTLGPNATISGNLSYESPQELSAEEIARVSGEVSYAPISERTDRVRDGAWAIFSLAYLVWFLAWFAAALILSLVFKRFSLELVSTALTRPWHELGRGFLALIAIPIASVILLVTVIGLPLGILGLISYVALLILSFIFTSVIIGSLLNRWIWKPETYRVNWWIILLGAIVSALLGFIPVVGWIIRLGFFLITLGAIVKTKTASLRAWR